MGIYLKLEILKSKIHRATVTDANLNYIGSITLDENLMDLANLHEFEKVQILNITNGNRLETYVIKGDVRGQIGINGPAALKMGIGDIVIIVAYAMIQDIEYENHQPIIIFPNENNNTLD